MSLTMDKIEEDYADDIVERVRGLKSDELLLEQKVIYVLLSNTLAGYSKEESDFGIGFRTIVGYPFWLFGGGALGWLSLQFAHLICHWLIGDWTDWVLYVLVAVGLLCVVVMKEMASDGFIEFDQDADNNWAIRGLKLGRLHEVLNSESVAVTAILGMIFGAQAGLIRYASHHMGAGDVQDFQQAFFLTLDNFCRGLFLDIFDVYQIYFAHPVEHTTWTATGYLIFRCSMNVLVLLSLYLIWSHIRLRKLLADVPTEPMGYQRLLEWLRDIRGSRWCRSFFDEYVFLMAVERYLDGRFDDFKDQTRRYPRLQVQDGVQSLFENREGTLLWKGYWTSWTRGE